MGDNVTAARREMTTSLRVLIVEDVEDDAVLSVRELRRAGYDVAWERVETREQMAAALERGSWDLILSDFSLPHFSGPAALELCRARGVSVPFVIVSGSIGDHDAAESMKAGAADFLVKGNLARLGPAVARELRDAAERRARHEAERRQGMAEERYRILVEQIPAVLYVADSLRVGRVLYISPQIEPMLGFHPDEWVADPELWRRQTDPEDCAGVDEAFERLRQAGPPAMCEYRMRSRDGREVWVRDEARLVPAGAGSVVQGILLDVTQRRRAEEEMRRQREAMHQTEKLAAMGQLLAGVAHELNNPLAVVMGQASMLVRALPDAATRTRVEKIEKAAERCARIVRNFLALARQEAPRRHRVPVTQTVEEALELMSYPLRVNGIEVCLELEPVPVLWADGHQLQQVLINLLTNAQHALRATPSPRRVVVSSRFDPKRQRVILEVADNGPGVPADAMPRLFEPFFTTKPAGQGTGLGLSLCRGIVEGHGGTLTVESAPGHGARFRIDLPVGAPAAIAPATAQPAPAPAAAVPRSILVVDDEPGVGELLADLLHALGHRAQVTHSARTALERLAAQSFDLIISDVRMPDLDGPGLHHEVGHRHPHLAHRFVFVTGDTLEPGTHEFLSRAALPHLAKPFDLGELERVVTAALGDAEGARRTSGAA